MRRGLLHEAHKDKESYSTWGCLLQALEQLEASWLCCSAQGWHLAETGRPSFLFSTYSYSSHSSLSGRWF